MMGPETVGPLSRLVRVTRLPPKGLDVSLQATPEECAALAADFGLPELKSLSAEFHVTGIAARVRVVGRVRADIVQVCVVTLDPFESQLVEEVEADFEELERTTRRGSTAEPVEVALDEDAADPIIDGHIDLGALAAEFFALGLDPNPRKPGVTFNYEEPDGSGGAFAQLAALKRDGD